MELLLDQTFAFTLADVRKNILVPFRVDRDFDHLAICLHYGPKAIRDPEIIMPQIRKCVKTYFPAGYQLTEADMQEYQELFNFVRFLWIKTANMWAVPTVIRHSRY